MTLSSNLPSAESATLPSDPLACLGVPAQTPDTGTASTPFATLLTEAGPASAPGVVVADSKPTAMPPPSKATSVIRWSAEFLGFYPADGSAGPVVPSDVNASAADAAPIVAQPQAQIQPQSSATVVAILPDVQSPVAPQAVPGQESKPRAATPARAKGQLQVPAERDKSSEKTTDTDKSSEDEASQGTAALVYQLVAGQWLPQPVVQPSVQEQGPGQKGELSATPNIVAEGTPVVAGEVTTPDRQSAVFLQTVGATGKTVGEKGKSSVQKAADATRTSKDFSSAFVSTAAVEPQNKNTPIIAPTAARPDRVEAPKEALPPVSAAGSNQPVNLPAENQDTAVGETLVMPNKLPEPEPEAEKPLSTLPQTNGVLENQKDLSPATGSALSSDGPKFQPQSDATTFRTAADLKAQFSIQEKFAAPQSVGRAESSSGVIPSTPSEEKKTVVIEGKKVSSTGRNVGTSVANRDVSMPYSIANKPSTAEFTLTPPVVSSGGLEADRTTPMTTASNTPVAVQAPRLVHEIREIADRISTIDRNTVEVRFDFSESERLSVRVEYRDGTVHTTFRTDSHQLRDAISNEWQTQAASSEGRSYRLAEPIFSSNSSAQQDLSSSGNGSGHSRSFEQPANSNGGAGLPRPGRSSSSGFSSAPTAPKPAARPETSRHLHTLA